MPSAYLQLLELPYRVLLLAAGDTGFASAKTYDLEAFAPGVGKWLEVSSSSNFTDFQGRRANIRFRPAGGGKPRFVHTLNASGLAFPRIIAAILEHHQKADGTFVSPPRSHRISARRLTSRACAAPRRLGSGIRRGRAADVVRDIHARRGTDSGEASRVG